jgi:UDP-glucose 4-epimerase
MKVLVTGGCGFIGQHLLTMLPTDTLDIVGQPTYLQDIRKSFTVEQEYDVVVHLAAKVQVGESVTDPLLYYDTNINGTINVLKNIKTNHFIFASTGSAEYMQSPYAISKKAAEEIVVEYCTKNNINYTIFKWGHSNSK